MDIPQTHPGFNFTQTVLTKRVSEPMVDKYGIALLSCKRGTKMMLKPFISSWWPSLEFGAPVSKCQKHSWQNAGTDTMKRLGFPRLGHYDTWIIHLIQILVEKNHNVLLYPDWSNSSDNKPTPESFGTVACILTSYMLHSTKSWYQKPQQPNLPVR